MNPRTALAGAVALVLAVLSGCTSNSTTATPTVATPTATELLEKSSAAMSTVTSAAFTLAIDGQLPSVIVQSAQGDLTAAGDAQGSAKIVQFGQLVEVDFVLSGGDLYIKGPTGGYGKVPAALAGGIYDPSAILNPDKGVPKVLTSVTNPTITGTDGEAWVVSGTVPAAVASGLVPGISSDVAAQLTIAMDSSQLTAAKFTLDGSDGKPATATVGLSNFNETVSISPPG
jgi:lipoprotein LprG